MVQTNFRTLPHGDHIWSETIPTKGGTGGNPPPLRTMYKGPCSHIDLRMVVETRTSRYSYSRRSCAGSTKKMLPECLSRSCICFFVRIKDMHSSSCPAQKKLSVYLRSHGASILTLALLTPPFKMLPNNPKTYVAGPTTSWETSRTLDPNP